MKYNACKYLEGTEEFQLYLAAGGHRSFIVLICGGCYCYTGGISSMGGSLIILWDHKKGFMQSVGDAVKQVLDGRVPVDRYHQPRPKRHSRSGWTRL